MATDTVQVRGIDWSSAEIAELGKLFEGGVTSQAFDKIFIRNSAVLQKGFKSEAVMSLHLAKGDLATIHLTRTGMVLIGIL